MLIVFRGVQTVFKWWRHRQWTSTCGSHSFMHLVISLAIEMRTDAEDRESTVVENVTLDAATVGAPTLTMSALNASTSPPRARAKTSVMTKAQSVVVVMCGEESFGCLQASTVAQTLPARPISERARTTAANVKVVSLTAPNSPFVTRTSTIMELKAVPKQASSKYQTGSSASKKAIPQNLAHRHLKAAAAYRTLRSLDVAHTNSPPLPGCLVACLPGCLVGWPAAPRPAAAPARPPARTRARPRETAARRSASNLERPSTLQQHPWFQRQAAQRRGGARVIESVLSDFDCAGGSRPSAALDFWRGDSNERQGEERVQGHVVTGCD